MKFSNYVTRLNYKNKVVIANKRNGYWMRLTNEIYDYFSKAIELGYSEEEFLDSFESLDDKKYIKSICNKMNELGIIGGEDDKQKKAITLELTNRCNLNCIHCCIKANEHQNDLRKDELLKILKKVVASNPEKIVLSGGEPLIRDDICELLQYLRSIYNGSISLCTNGLLINKDNIDILIKCTNQIDISIDGVDEDSCKKIRGVNVFEKVIQNVKLLKENGYKKISLSIAINDKNKTLEPAFYELNDRLGTHPIVRITSIVGRGVENRELLTNLSEGEVYIPDSFYSEENKLYIFYGNCAEKFNYFIRYNGDIFACPTIIDDNYIVNNINNISYINEIQNKKLYSLTSDLMNKNNKCKECEVRPFCWKCLAHIKEYTENDAMNDYCNKVKKIYFNVVWGE